MKRSPLKRSIKALKRTELKRSDTPINKRGKKAKAWDKFRPIAHEAIDQTYGEMCVRCRIRKWTDLHHVEPRSTAPDLILDVSQIFPFCRVCHNWVGDNPEEAEEEGWHKKSGYELRSMKIYRPETKED